MLACGALGVLGLVAGSPRLTLGAVLVTAFLGVRWGRAGPAAVAGDLAVMIELGRLMGLDEKPSEKQLRELAEQWRPYRGAAAVLAWHSYNSSVL